MRRPQRWDDGGAGFTVGSRPGVAYVAVTIMARTLVRQTPFELDGHEYVVVSAEDEAQPPAAALARLTPSEREVAALAAEGLSSQEIAARRQRSARTVENQLAAIFRKLEVGSRAELLVRLGRSR